MNSFQERAGNTRTAPKLPVSIGPIFPARFDGKLFVATNTILAASDGHVALIPSQRTDRVCAPLRRTPRDVAGNRTQFLRTSKRKDLNNEAFRTLHWLTRARRPLAVAQTSTWVPDRAHSEVDFSILHMSLSNVHGRFGNIGGSIALNESDISKSTVSITIDVSSVDTGVSARDTDLKSANFFDVAQFPTATFASTSVAKERQRVDGERAISRCTA